MVSASGISFNADDETGEIGAILLRQIDNGVRAALPHENEVVRIEGVSLLFPVAIRQGRRIDVLCNGFREVELAGNHVAVIDKELEVNMGRAAWIPAGIDRSEPHISVSPGELRPPGNVSPFVEPVSWPA